MVFTPGSPVSTSGQHMPAMHCNILPCFSICLRQIPLAFFFRIVPPAIQYLLVRLPARCSTKLPPLLAEAFGRYQISSSLTISWSTMVTKEPLCMQSRYQETNQKLRVHRGSSCALCSLCSYRRMASSFFAVQETCKHLQVHHSYLLRHLIGR
jgi:hypothetical protein